MIRTLLQNKTNLTRFFASQLRPLSQSPSAVGSKRFDGPEGTARLKNCGLLDAYNTARETGVFPDKKKLDALACQLREWAQDQGADSFGQWWLPLGAVSRAAGPSMPFLCGASPEGKPLYRFRGKDLEKGSCDGSSFPNGGMRTTAEARAMTRVDYASAPFVSGRTLHIPHFFESHYEDALDDVAPLAQATKVCSKAASELERVLRGGAKGKKMVMNVGVEQEFFLVDRERYLSRPDLVGTGRVLFGNLSAFTQEREENYFGMIPKDVDEFLAYVTSELWALNIPTVIRHSEVAPCQFEIVPLFNDVRRSVVNNIILKNLLTSSAADFGLACLLHEKPFGGVNGSAAHTNWSLCFQENNKSMFETGPREEERIRQIVFTTAVIRAVHLHQDLLRVAAGNSENDHRLGSHEAPPGIVSVGLGGPFAEFMKCVADGKAGVADYIVPPKHEGDRNRTSPMAYVNDRFEFRAVGSSQNPALATVLIQTLMAESMEAITHEIEALKESMPVKEAINSVVQEELREHLPIVFEGDGYSAEWVVEAEARGLQNFPRGADALRLLDSAKNVALFEKYGVLSAKALHARKQALAAHYDETYRCEARFMHELTHTKLLPAVFRHVANTAEAADLLGDNSPVQRHVARLKTLANQLVSDSDEVEAVLNAKPLESADLELARIADDLRDAMERTKTTANTLEPLVEDWPLENLLNVMSVEPTE